MHGTLKPWKLDTTNTRRFVELVKAAKAASPVTNADLHKHITALLTDFPTLQKLLPVAANTKDPLQPLQYKTDLPSYKDPVTNFYYFVITAETLRVYNAVLLQAATLSDLVDIQYQVGKILNDIKVLAKQTAAELQEQGFTTTPTESSNHIHFALHYLKHSLILLYFSIQKAFETQLQQTVSLDDFYLLDLELPISAVQQIEYIGKPDADVEGNTEDNGNQNTVCFGFKDDVAKLTTVVNQLCYQIDLLNEDVTSADELIKAFTAKSILPGV